MHVSINKTTSDICPGQCICQSCPFKCHRITDLRKHLTEEHNKIFHEENITFENYPGEKLFHCNYAGTTIESLSALPWRFWQLSKCLRPLSLCFLPLCVVSNANLFLVGISLVAQWRFSTFALTGSKTTKRNFSSCLKTKWNHWTRFWNSTSNLFHRLESCCSLFFFFYLEFNQWKVRLEETENCSFVKSTGEKQDLKGDARVQYFQCNRSGIAREATKTGKRREKSQGEFFMFSRKQ